MRPTEPPEFLFHPKVHEIFNGIMEEGNKNAVQAKLRKVLENPTHFTAPLHGPLSGDREVRVLQDLRVIVTFCWECVETGHQHKHQCPCDEIPKNSIIVWWIGNHKEMGHAQGVTSMPWPNSTKPCP